MIGISYKAGSNAAGYETKMSELKQFFPRSGKRPGSDPLVEEIKTACGFRRRFSFILEKCFGCFENRLVQRAKVLGSLAKRLGSGLKILGAAPKDLA